MAVADTVGIEYTLLSNDELKSAGSQIDLLSRSF